MGVRIEGMVGGGPPPYSCEDFNLVEAQLMALLPATPENNIAWYRVRGYRVFLHPTLKFTDFWGRSVAGWNMCITQHIEIGTSDHHLAWTAFGHELVHAAQACQTPQPTDEGLDVDHANWNRDNIYPLLNNLAGMH
jgi:hypothetical protein